MLLRSIEVYGFKSFAEKTQLEFGRGVTAIVGPNGSGKSNISDAIRWTLGEQSARMLRGSKMEDIIFAGSASRKALGIAEVSLSFDNSDGRLPLDYSEIIITRRVFRSGDSEYYINKTLCRLKDIYDLLSDSGLGRDSMTVIGQNKVDEILSSKPEERRLLFEEAAGIAKYKQRKKEALRKLESTEQNLVRLDDIVSEIESQLEPLSRSADKTLKFNKLSSELKSCQVTLLLDKLEKSEKMAQSAQLEKESLSEEIVILKTKLILNETEKEKLTLELFNLENELTGFDREIGWTDTEFERIAGKKALLTERIAQGRNLKERNQEELARLHNDKIQVEEELTKLRQKLSDNREKAANLNEALALKTREYDELGLNIRNSEENIQTGQEKTFDNLKSLVDERNNLKNLERDNLNIKIRQKNLADEHLDYLEQNRQNILLRQEHENNYNSLCQKAEDNCRKMRDILGKENQIGTELTSLKKGEAKLTGKINETSSRLNVLTSMQKDFEGFGRAVKEVLKPGGENWRSGICGAVAQLLTTENRYVTAVEIALGGALQHIVTDNEHIAKETISFLKKNKLGRATFLPLNTIKTFRPKNPELTAAANDGALGFISEFVTCEERYSKIVEFLLGRTILAENIDTALKIARQSSFSVKIVTLEGELLNPGGSMTGGSFAGREAGFLARTNQIDSLKKELTNRRQELVLLQENISRINSQLTDLVNQSQLLAKENQEIDLKKTQMEIYLERTKSDSQSLTLALSTIEAEITSAQKEEEELKTEILTSQNNLLTLENQDTAQKTEINQLEENLKIYKVEQERLNTELTGLKVELASLTGQIESIAANSRSYEQTELSLKTRLERLLTEQTENVAKIDRSEEELANLDEEQAGVKKIRKDLEQKRLEGQAKKLELLARNQNIEKEVREIRRKDSEFQRRIHEAEILFTKYDSEVSYATDQITVSFNLALDEARTFRRMEKIEVLLKLVKELEEEITGLGQINPAAIEEYERVKERYEFLQKQIQDLVAAKDYLTSIISDIDRTMIKQFTAAFKEIDRHFAEVFTKLFGGGKARLELVEPDNILETGIEIIVEPPGKKRQNMALLSGGERALTVIALLFAFLTYRPAPFCVVDEVDASLDEANVKRFGEFLKDYAATTQFIVVTHRKGTMEAADVLHGVTMEESGISRMVSVKLVDKAG